jgi:hypothetical protein
MVEAPLSERLEYAILEIVCRDRSESTHQDDWGGWCTAVRQRAPEFVSADLLAAFRRLWRRGALRLTKPDSECRHAYDYSGNETDNEDFFFVGTFNATITDEGRSVWNNAEEPKTAVFISSTTEEKAVALRLQALVRMAFANAFPIFVAGDPVSLGGGEEWYHHILENLAKARVVLVLLSPDSEERPWINFEAGLGRGQKSRVIPLLFRGLSFDEMQYPLKGLQGYHLQQLGDILQEISRRMGTPAGTVDLNSAWEDIQVIQAELPAKSLALELRPCLTYPKWSCEFFVVNSGNRDVEPLEVTIWILSAILYSPYHPAIDRGVLEVRDISIDNVVWTEITYRNNRELHWHRAARPQPLVACLPPGSAQVLELVRPEIRFPLTAHDLKTPIRYRIIAKGMRPAEGTINLESLKP